MKIDTAYKKALKTPKRGWANAEGDSLLAIWADQLGWMFCVRPVIIFNWSKKYKMDLQKIFNDYCDKKLELWEIVGPIINDKIINKYLIS